MRIVFAGTFGMAPKSTMKVRALPLAKALVGRGHQVSMVLPPWDNPGDSGKRYEEGGVSVVNLDLPPRLPGTWYGLLGLRLLAATASLKPDVVHAFKPKGFSGFVAQTLLVQRVLGRSGPRVVVDTDDWEGDGGWNDVEPYPWWQQRLFSYQERWLMKHADAVTPASRTLTDLATGLRGGPAAVYYLPNGTQGQMAPAAKQEGCSLREELGLGEGSVILLYTRFVEFAPVRAAAIFEAIAASGQRPAVLLVGEGLHGEEATFLMEMKRRAPQLKVVRAGWVQQADLPRYFAAADVALFPMDDTLLNRAKCSVKLVDLLSAGVPVIAEAVGQSAEYIEDGVSGLLTMPGDRAAMAGGVVRLLKDRELRAGMGRAAQERMLTAYRWEKLAEVCERAYGS